MFIVTHQSHPDSQGEIDWFTKNKIKYFPPSAKFSHDVHGGRVVLLNMCLRNSVSTTREICNKGSNSINLTSFDVLLGKC